MLRVTFLGTGGSLPSPNRNPPAIMVNRKGEGILFDCGEGTQRQMMLARTGLMNVSTILITHFHADHFLGMPGLIQTMSFQDRKDRLEIIGPAEIGKLVKGMLSYGYFRLDFDIKVTEVNPGDTVKRKEYDITAVGVDHNVPALGYVLQEHERLGRFDREKAVELDVPPGPLFAKLHRGGTVIVDGREVKSEEVVGPPRSGRKLVYSGDTRPCDAILDASREADLLIHDGSFTEELKDWAIESKHSTAFEAATLASKAHAKRLVLTHISSRYSADAMPILEEGRKVFRNVIVADDLMTLEVPYPDKVGNKVDKKNEKSE